MPMQAPSSVAKPRLSAVCSMEVIMADPYPVLWIAGTTKSPRNARAKWVRKGLVAAVLFIARLHFR
jgi:hypothetical protein